MAGLVDPRKLVERDELLDAAERLLTDAGRVESWSVTSGDIWTYFECKQQVKPAQGWKLHVTATPLSAAVVIGRVLPVLFERGVSFKMVRSKPLLARLNDAHAPRAASGKFITVYPSDDAEAVDLAAACDDATRGMTGPVILSDRQYTTKSIIYYRYGGFARRGHYDYNGRFVYTIQGPGGQPAPDLRTPWFSAPAWVQNPFDPDGQASAGVERPNAVILKTRYRITHALRHANKGGVYLASDLWTGEQVVVKEARPQVCMDRFGRDAVDSLKAEASNLERLAPLGVAARVLDFFEERNHHFLVLERLPGKSLRDLRKENDGPMEIRDVLRLARALSALLADCHRARMVVRDFTPNNIIVLPDGSLRVIDLELAHALGQTSPTGVAGATPGYASPQQMRGEAPCLADDSYSLAATLFFLATSRDPLFLPDAPKGRAVSDRVQAQLAAMCDDGFLPHEFPAPIVAGLSEHSSERWTASEVYAHLLSVPDNAAARARRPRGSTHAFWSLADGIVRDLTSFALGSIELTSPEEIVRSSCTGAQFDPCNVQYGAAGVGLFLLSVFTELDAAGRARVGDLARRVATVVRDKPLRPPGLYFGTAGAAWFLLEAGLTLHDEDLKEAASSLVIGLEPAPRRVDVTHGASGIGLALLHFFRRAGGTAYRDAAARLADDIVATAEESPMGSIWTQHASPGERGAAFYGFAHGNAGVAYFLLSVFLATGEPRYLDASVSAAETLVRSCEITGGYAYWPHGPERATKWTYWCNGSAGVGTSLLRLYKVTGDRRYRILAKQAAAAVHRHRWHVPFSQCHGLAGNAEFLLDMYQVLGDEEYREMAFDLADVLVAHRAVQHGRALFGDEGGASAAPDYAVGNSGIGAFFHRLRTNGPRLLMVDELAERPSPETPASAACLLAR